MNRLFLTPSLVVYIPRITDKLNASHLLPNPSTYHTSPSLEALVITLFTLRQRVNTHNPIREEETTSLSRPPPRICV